MNILGLDTSGQVASCAIINNHITIGEFTVNYKMNHSETFLPLIENLFKSVSMELSEINYIAVSSGPGSFTGLRIGASIAVSFAHAMGIKILPVPTLDALAYTVLYQGESLIVPIIDARRNQVYSALYEDGKKISDYMAEDINDVIKTVNSYNKPAIFLGDGILLHRNLIFENGHKIAPVNNNMQRGSSVALASLNLIEKAVDYSEFELMYLKKTQAEREYEEKNDRNN
ncbi:MAG: tRNA (adenosine(37)-N6)-threonylcarbamoyltransferase complex dimerization subunit type 1 TsaB [Defluviitaleaceae bacterium]|nr:tRNA (adenosine(37)-N6)-threonylcarbamoyltransferase complex dimerization subunit type 1 TsaB [Defluviitaleaceae bacterium]